MSISLRSWLLTLLKAQLRLSLCFYCFGGWRATSGFRAIYLGRQNLQLALQIGLASILGSWQWFWFTLATILRTLRFAAWVSLLTWCWWKTGLFVFPWLVRPGSVMNLFLTKDLSCATFRLSVAQQSENESVRLSLLRPSLRSARPVQITRAWARWGL